MIGSLLLFFTVERREERGEEVHVVRKGGRGRGREVGERTARVGKGRGRGRGIPLLSTKPHPPTRRGESCSLSIYVPTHVPIICIDCDWISGYTSLPLSHILVLVVYPCCVCLNM